ncbi:DUF748 domain-containing protein [Arenimonas sp. GDDSR-1]|uniref:DUF748 domain-containing protein n=1 Tax=Arenimonas sp. GDDSR-1 TaxID=2950125 RepID=UPI0026159075|nr:DUF748 domain-containing protein [Arenimonas sp. GDDSR-1]
MLAWMKSKWLLLIGLLVLAVGAYALIGFKVVPKLIRNQAMDYAQTELKKPLALGEIRFNPFTFELDMRDIVLQDGGKPLLSLKRLFVDFQASSLFKRAFVFNTVLLDKPFARAIIKPDGSLNLADLLPKERNDDPLPNVWIGDLGVNAGQVNFADQSRALKPEKVLAPITFSLKDFKTRDDGGGFVLAATSDDGERFEWRGSLSLEPVASKGNFKVEAFKAVSAYEFLSEELPFQLSDGSFSLSGDYDFSILGKSGPRLLVNLPSIRADKLAIRPKNGPEDWLRLPSVVLSETRIDLNKQSASVAAINLQGVQAKVWLNPDGSLNIERLFAEEGAPAPPPASAGAPAWKATIGKISVSAATLDVEDRTVKPAGKFQLTPTEFTASGLSLDLDKPVPIAITSTINGKAPLRIEGTVVPSVVTADLALELSGMPMNQLLMYLPDFPGTTFKSGTVAAKGRLSMDEKANIAYQGDGVVDNLVLLDIKNRSEVISLAKTTAKGIDYRQGPEKIRIDSVTLDRPSMEVVVTEQGSINLVEMLTEDTASTAQSGSKDAVAETPIDIGKLVFNKGTMRFADYSIQPNFRARIEGLDGRILGISTRPDAVADIDLNGYVINKYSPVVIKGKTSIFDYEKQTDVQMAFRNIELPVFNPYSGRFAGYAIAKGKLTTELHYRINDKKLQADHHVVLDQLTWGQATGSKEAVSLPIRLATALLKDRNGVIDLNVPVTGTLDDPKFRIGPIVWQIIKNIVVKVVTAPFSFIGGLFAGAEEAQFIDFAPGSAELPAAAATNLPQLAKALVDKPELNLDIPAGVLDELDRDALAERKMQAAAAAQIGKPGKNMPAYAEWEPKQQLDALESLYKAQFGSKPDIPKAEAVTESADDAGWREKRAAKKSHEVDWLETQLMAKFQPTAAELAALGAARGEAVQDALLKDGTLDPTRVFLSTNAQLKAQDGKVRMELQMK